MAHIITGQEKVIIKAVSPDGSVSTGDLFVLSAADNGTTLVTIDGDLTVTGTQTINQSVSLQIEDKFLEVNRNNSTAGTEDSGIFFNQGTQNAAIFYYDGADNEFLFGTTTNTPSDASISNITLANVKVATTPSDANHAASKSYVDSQVSTSNSIIMVGDDSTGTTLTQGETFKIAGTQNVTTAVSGDTLTVTGPDLTGYVTASSSNTFTNKSGNISQWTNDSAYITDANITIVGDDSTGVTLSAKNGDDFKIRGAQNVVTAVSGNVLTITGPNLNDYITASTTDTFTNKTIDANGSGNSITNLEVADFAAASIVTAAESIGSNNNDTTIPTSAAVKAYADSVSGGASSLGDLTAVGSTLTAPSNADLTLQGGGTGAVIIEGITVQGDTITSTSSSQILVDDSIRVTGTLTTDTLVVSTISAPTNLSGTYSITSPTTITLDPTDEIINDAPMKLLSRTVSQLSSLVASAGSMVYCTDETGGAVPCFYDGSNWRRVTDRAVAS